MRHCRRSTSHFGYDRSGEGWVFERKKKRDKERSREGGDQSGNKRSRKEESQPLVFIRLCISSVCPCPLSPLPPPSFRWNKTSSSFAIPLSLPSTLKSSLNSLFLCFLPVSTLLTLRFHPFPPFFFSSRNAFSSFPFNTRFLRVPSACLHLGILSRFCRRARAKFVFERVPVWGYGGEKDEQRFNCWISLSNY